VSKTDPTKLVVAGHYLSVWQRDDKGELHNVIDLGVEHAEQPLGTHVARQGPALITAQRLTPAAFNARLQTLLSADRMLAARLAASEGQAALATVAESEAIMLRDGSGPVEIGHAKLDAQPLPRMDLAAIRLSKAGDMGATSGWNGDPKARRAYTRVWRWTADGWRVVADVLGG
jgi:hypothetical protein